VRCVVLRRDRLGDYVQWKAETSCAGHGSQVGSGEFVPEYMCTWNRHRLTNMPLAMHLTLRRARKQIGIKCWTGVIALLQSNTDWWAKTTISGEMILGAMERSPSRQAQDPRTSTRSMIKSI
jgi:hypothetical protein